MSGGLREKFRASLLVLCSPRLSKLTLKQQRVEEVSAETGLVWCTRLCLGIYQMWKEPPEPRNPRNPESSWMPPGM